MDDDLRERADARLEEALGRDGAVDPRPHLRSVLRYLRERDRAAFERALHHFDSILVPAVAADADPVGAWRDYARVLATAVGAGRALAVDASGRAWPADGDAGVAGAGGERLELHVPDEPASPVVVLAWPAEMTPAQKATAELLVLRRQTASLYD